QQKKVFLEELRIQDSALHQLIPPAYHLLPLPTYFTPPLQQLPPSTFKQPINPPQSPALIHTHFHPPFIPPQTLSYHHLITNPSITPPKEPPKLPLQPKQYILKHPHLIHFPFNL
ncbi:DUF933 domain-containing protein, partial [Bacillus thuringiensis]|uniref:DUF933 domain-containing protein n=1 Tax=Bacillus thuringiensis TaxID=1428 RepID=UPI0011A36292